MKSKTKRSKKKWRGIETTQRASNEVTAVTIVNRLGQKSMSLPRIDDEKRWAGYPGLAGTAKKIAALIPFTTTYVEPFAGSAKVYQEFIKRGDWHYERIILNDTSDFVNEWLNREFPEATTPSMDFAKCIKKYDGPNTIFIIDPPWVKSYYNQGFSSFNRDTVKQYDEELVELCKDLKGLFIITSRKENKTFKASGFNHKLIKSIYVVSGKYPRVMLSHNLIIE